MGVRGDFGKLRALRGGLARMASGKTARRVVKAIAHTALELAQEGFVAAMDPYGRAWKPLKYRSGQPLRDTGRLFNSLTVRSSSVSFSLLSNVAYSEFHQEGTKHIPRRPYFPDGRGIPSRWSREFKLTADELLESEVPR